MRDVLSIVAALAFVALFAGWVFWLRARDRKKLRVRDKASADSSRELRDRLGAETTDYQLGKGIDSAVPER